MIFRDTIAAIATPPGPGGIGVIRISGPAAAAIARRLFRPAQPLSALESHRLYHGTLVRPGTDEVLDEVLVAFLKGPHSYTGEDTVEINCHGGPLLLQTVLGEVIRAGARPADRGEFTKRAFLNDRLDLAQAEAVCDLINAQSEAGLGAAVARLQGRFSERIDALRSRVLDLLAVIEAAIDFSAEEGVLETEGPDRPEIGRLVQELQALAATHRRGRITREGLSLVITGRPNVGKSSLLNRLLGERRAIVASQPGTTRDFIEEALDLGGIPVRLTDTAGIQPTTDAVEQAGIDLVWERLAKADAVLVLFDGSQALTEADQGLLARLPDKPLLAVINKADLPLALDEEALRRLLPDAAGPVLQISAKYGQGIESLQEAIRALVPTLPGGEAEATLVAHRRHRQALEQAAEALQRAGAGLEAGLSPELVALEVREAADALGEIAGRTAPEEVLERIFSRFCIGK